ncbi:hypothetical protein HG530_003317 [Fusarium avenaceum]|nr:hypothetical protein HG530_003317 [Fusarium avenaceum]
MELLLGALSLATNFPSFLHLQESLALLLRHNLERIANHTSLKVDALLLPGLHVTANTLLDHQGQLHVTLSHKTDGLTLASRTGGTTDTVDVVIRVAGKIVVDD